jgi:PIN domain nuclease of toxin-antitoxin system
VKLLLDTHIFLWFITEDSKLSNDIKTAIVSLQNQVYLSSVSIWECLTKYRLGKLSLPRPPEQYLIAQRRQHNVLSLALDESSVQHLVTLPNLHRDPFDRMLVCQAIEHGLTLVTVDKAVLCYPVALFEVEQ